MIVCSHTYSMCHENLMIRIKNTLEVSLCLCTSVKQQILRMVSGVVKMLHI